VFFNSVQAAYHCILNTREPYFKQIEIFSPATYISILSRDLISCHGSFIAGASSSKTFSRSSVRHSSTDKAPLCYSTVCSCHFEHNTQEAPNRRRCTYLWYACSRNQLQFVSNMILKCHACYASEVSKTPCYCSLVLACLLSCLPLPFAASSFTSFLPPASSAERNTLRNSQRKQPQKKSKMHRQS